MCIFDSLKPNIAIFAPAGPIDQDRLDETLKLWELENINYQIMPHVFSRSAPESYLSATVVERVDDLHQAWSNQYDMLIPTRGGYGCAQILSYLNYKLLARSNPQVLGYSDLTALHLAMTAAGVGTPVSAPMAGRFAELLSDPANLASFQKAIGAKNDSITIDFEGKTYTSGIAEGLPMVVNLTVCASLCGTPFIPKTDNRIIIIEDINETPYRIDRALNQLMLAGFFDAAKAVIFGDFTNCGNPDELDIIFARTAAYGEYLTCSGFPFGHASRVTSLNWTKLVKIYTSSGQSRFTII